MYVVQLKLKTKSYENIALFKRFKIAEIMQNNCIRKFLGRLCFMQNSKDYQRVLKMEKSKARTQLVKECIEKYGLTRNDYYHYISTLQKHYKNYIDSQAAQIIANKVKSSIDKKMFRKSNKVHYIKPDSLKSIQGQSNISGITFDFETKKVDWLKLSMNVVIRKNDKYVNESFAYCIEAEKRKIEWKAKTTPQQRLNERLDKLKRKTNIFGGLSYCIIIRKYVKNKFVFYLQLVIDGLPPVKVRKIAFNKKVGLDIGTSTISYVSKDDAKLKCLCESYKEIYDKIRLLKKKCKNQIKRSKNNIKTKLKIQELYRYLTERKKHDYEKLANEIIKNGNILNIENMNYGKIKVRSKDKRFGKTIQKFGPAKFLRILNNKLIACNGTLNLCDTYKLKASQFNHITSKCTKKTIEERWNVLYYNGNIIWVQRDLYSAFLLFNSSLNEIDVDSCIKNFDAFLINHESEIERLQELKKSGYIIPSCMGI